MVTETSDLQYKDNIRTIDGALDKVMRLRGVEFDWRRNQFKHMRFDAGTQIGVIAQEVEAVIPELVRIDPEGHRSVAYANITAVLIEALKEQQTQIVSLRAQIESLKADVESVLVP